MNLASAEFSDRVESCGWRTCVVIFPDHKPVVLWHSDVDGLSEDDVIALAAERIDVPVSEDEQADYEYTLLKHGMNTDGTLACPMLVDTILRAGGCGGPVPETEELTIEQMCRNLLTFAIRERLVNPTDHEDIESDPQDLGGSDLTGMANVLASYLRDTQARRRS